MSIYVYTGTPWTENEVQKIYLWDPWWIPWENTVAYYPLETDGNDYTWNYNLTNSSTTFTTISWVKCADFTSNVYLYSTNIPLPSWSSARTFSYWFYNSSVVNDTYFLAYWSHANWCFFAPRTSWTVYSFMGYNRDFNTSTTVQTWKWQLQTITYDGTTVKYYLDWNLIWNSNQSLSTTAIWSTWKFTVWCRLNSSTNPWNYINWYMSNLIVEDKVWTATEITDYYNLTKSDYGIS